MARGNCQGKHRGILRKSIITHMGKKVAGVGFVWHPGTLFQPNDILIGTSVSCRKFQ